MTSSLQPTSRQWLLAAFLLLAFIVTQAPAALIDTALATHSGHHIRLLERSGTLWRGRGVLAESTPQGHIRWLTVAWQIAPFGLIHGRPILDVEFDDQPVLNVTASQSGLELRWQVHPVDIAPLIRTLTHPAARLGWHARASVPAGEGTCNWRMRCRGAMALELSALATSVLPGPSLGRFGLQLGLEERTLSIVVVSPSDNRLQASASMVVHATRSSSGDIRIGGDPELVKQLGALTGDVMQRQADGTLQVQWRHGSL
ncbi:MAG TPA: type II secretion system protein N [Thauera sp.]|uniref:type II secretion system protein N n=1 Tax=Thauera sp. 28 TaxID=303682 RepID=UPI001E484BB7|nr:type II secretion system protein N [Thauera sp. 28]HNR62033.1 type II secretion system protein N [Thauera sp.]HNS92046.1 type II secretion system protein N [Thauera sp.]